MACTVTELNTLRTRYRAFLDEDAVQTRPRLRDAQHGRGYAICDYMQEINPRTQVRNTYGYGVSPTGTGKTVQGCSMIIGMNRLPQSGNLVLGDAVQGRRTVVHVPTNLLLDRWEEELLGMPDGHGGRRPGNFPEIHPEHVGIYRASDSFEAKLEALQKPIVLITYDSARILANRQPPALECDATIRDGVYDILSGNISASRLAEVRRILSQDSVGGDQLYRLFDIMHQALLPREMINQLSELLGMDFISENHRQQLQGHFLEALTNQASQNPNKTTLALLDEVDDRPRGDATRRYVQEFILPNCLTLGLTATHVYRNGRTTGDYVFGGLIPIFETPFQEAVNGREIAPMRNMAFEVDIPQENRAELAALINQAMARARQQGAREHDLDYSDRELEKMARLSGIDDTAINILLNGSDPDTHKRYLDMKSVWYCANVGHAQEVARKINEGIERYLNEHPDERTTIRTPYAEAVHGRLEQQEFDAVIVRFREGQTKALTNNIIMTRGFDDREAELCFQLCPSRSPNRVMQQGGRVMRWNPQDRHKIANIISFLFPPEILRNPEEQMVFGQLAGGQRLIPNDYEFPPTEGHENSGRDPRWWLNITGIHSVITSDEEYRIFRQRQGARSQAKPEHMLTVEQMARLLNPQAQGERLTREVERLRHRLYEPLAAAYQVRQARQQYVGLEDTAQDESNTLAVRGQPFPVWRLGNYMVSGQQQFCIDQGIANLCRYGLFGAINQRPPEFMTESMARQQVTGSSSNNPEFNALMGRIMDAYLDRPGNAQTMELDGHRLSTRTIGFFRRPGNDHAVDFCVSAEALCPIYQILRQASQQEAQTWWSERFSNYKTREWLNLDDVRRELAISVTSADNAALDQQWNRIRAAAGRVGSRSDPWQERTVRLRPDNQAQDVELRCANRRTPNDQSPQLCVHDSSLTAIECLLGRANVQANDATRPPRGRRRNGGNQ